LAAGVDLVAAAGVAAAVAAVVARAAVELRSAFSVDRAASSPALAGYDFVGASNSRSLASTF
jgi:hypothetical protein